MTDDAIAKPGPTPSSLLMLRPTPEELETAREASRQRDAAEYTKVLAHFKIDMGSENVASAVRMGITFFDTFICRHCGWEFEQRMNGAFSLDLKVTPIQNATRRMQTHLRGCKVFKRGQ